MPEDKPATQGERIAALEEELDALKAKVTELDGWGDEVQAWIDNRANTDESHSRKVSELDTKFTDTSGSVTEQLTQFDNALRLLLDDRFGKNVRPAGFDDNTRIPDPADPDHPSNNPVQEESGDVQAEAPVESARIDALESKLDRLLDALNAKD